MFYSLHVDRPTTCATVSHNADTDGVIVVSRDNRQLLNMSGVGGNLSVTHVDSEIDLLSAVVTLVTQYV